MNEKEKNKTRHIKKNQIVIAALTLMLGVAGYLNFAGNNIDLTDGVNDETKTAFAKGELGTAQDAEYNYETVVTDVDLEENIILNSDEENIGEAVLTSAGAVTMNAAGIKLNREQVRSKVKENYLEIINGDGMDDESVKKATDAYIKMSEDMEKENETETILQAKGFNDVIVSIGDSKVDVIIGREELSDVERAQIEDVVLRKTGCTIEQIVITLAGK